MDNDRHLLKNKIGNIILIGYFSFVIVLSLLNMPSTSAIETVIFILGVVFGLGARATIIVIYWYTVAPRYINEDKKVNVIQLFVGILLIELASSFTFRSFELFIVLSIVIMLKKDYHVLFVNGRYNNIFVRRISMIDSLIVNRMKLVKSIFIIVFLLTAVYALIFSADIFQDRLVAIGLSLLTGLVSVGMVYFILKIQVKNPFCSKKILNFFCNLFICFALVLLFMGFVSLILYRKAFTVVGVSSAEGIIIGCMFIKQKYVLAER
ncbi:MAG: hypothetical protein VB106_19275 [Clostridiaceae bacterium]|nr:hypothetical protein [Clostridiaceae bacterium]